MSAKVGRLVGLVGAFVVCVVLASTAKAQDVCADILRDGTVQNIDWKQKDYYRNLIYARFASMSYDQSKSERSFGLSVPIGEEVMGNANYDESAFREKQRSIEKTFFNDTTQSREVDVAITRGDSVIVDAWSRCMGNRQVLSLYFTRESNREATLTLVWRPGDSTIPEVTLYRDVLITDGQGNTGADVATILDGAECLKAGKVLKMNTPCPVSIVAKSASTPVSARATTTNGARVSRATWPARVRLAQEARPYPFIPNCGSYGGYNIGATRANVDRFAAWKAQCKDRPVAEAYRGENIDTRTISLSPEEVASGWRFYGPSASLAISGVYGVGVHGHRCDPPITRLNETRTSWSYAVKAVAPSQKDLTAICIGQPAIDMVRDVVVEQ
jgi:hypothetical protein